MASTILLEPGCPSPTDSSLRRALNLFTALAGARWVTLEIQRHGRSACFRYSLGDFEETGTRIRVLSPGRFSATLTLDSRASIPPGFSEMVHFTLDAMLSIRRLRHQSWLLRSALDTTSSAILLFDRQGNIAYANPPADSLLSRQTEAELEASEAGRPARPLLSVLCSWVDELVGRPDTPLLRRTTLALSDGSILACELLRVQEGADTEPGFVALLQPIVAGPDASVGVVASNFSLSKRERDVLHQLAAGLTTAEIASALGISQHTVQDHLKRLYRKTNSHSRSELLSLLSQAGLHREARPL